MPPASTFNWYVLYVQDIDYTWDEREKYDIIQAIGVRLMTWQMPEADAHAHIHLEARLQDAFNVSFD